MFQELVVRLMSLLHCSALQLVCKLEDAWALGSKVWDLMLKVLGVMV